MNIRIKENGNIKTISFSEFVNSFSKAYFFDYDEYKVKGIVYPRSSIYVENKVLDGSYMKREEFARMVAWKIGKICHKDSKTNNKIVYADDWIDCEYSNPLRYKKEFELNELHVKLRGISSQLRKLIKNDKLEDSYNLIFDNKINGIGPVYVIAILYFVSEGTYPIYDRFVHTALNIIYIPR